MAFNTVSNNQQQSDDNRVQVDWEALNKHVVEVAQLQQPETVTGIISQIVDLGIQPQNPAEYIFEGNEEDEREEVAKNPYVSFETRDKFYNDGKWHENVRLKIVPKKDAQSVALVVDFPDIIVDKGQFFGNSNPQPLRMLIGGEFKPSKESPVVVAKPFPLSVRKNDKTNNQWSIPFNNTLYKMAVATKLITQGEPFTGERVDELLGKAMQFKVQIGFNKNGYYFEKCAFAAGLARGMNAPEVDQSLLGVVQFSVQNDENALKMLRASIKNTIKRATNYEGSVLQGQLNALEGGSVSQTQTSQPQQQASPAEKPKVVKKEEPKPVITPDLADGWDDDIPF